MKRHSWKLLVTLVLTAGFLAAWLGFKITLGIDLQGGSVLIYQLDFAKLPPKLRTAETTDATIEILQRRLDALQIQEMSIRRAGDDQILIQLPGESEQRKEQIKHVIATAGSLWMKIVVPPSDPEYSEKLVREIEERKARGDYIADEEPFDTARDRDHPGRILLLRNEDAVDGNYISDAGPLRDEIIRQEIPFSLRDKGRTQLARTTEKWRGKNMAIVLDGVVQSDPVIRSPIPDGSGVIEGRFTKKEAESLITVLKSGALPAKPILQSEDSIAATLGADSIRRGIVAVGIGLGLIVAFMVAFYGKSGLIADIALVMNLVLLLGTLALFEATLTLPGIVGVLLTMGMAVDANILINERMREERERGLPIQEVVDAGYKHAFSAIFDSNITTVLSAVILYLVGTGPIKGYAVTLTIGIACSMFTALWVTRACFDWAIDRGWIRDFHSLRVFKGAAYPWIRKRMPFVFAALFFMNAGYALFALRGDEKYGIDFNGGTLLQMRLRVPMTTAEVEKRLAAYAETEGEKTLHPYAGVEIQALGARDPATGGYRTFQLLHTIVGEGERTASADEAPRPAAAPAAPTATAAVPSASATVAAAEEEVGGRAAFGARSPLQRFLASVERLFEKELLPPPFSPLEVVNVPDRSGMVRIAIEVRLDPDALERPENAPDMEAIRRALSGEGYAEAELSREGAAIRLRTAPLDVTKQPIESHEARIKTIFEKNLSKVLSNPFPFRTSIGASVAHNLKSRAIVAIVLSLVMMSIYIAFRFDFKAGLAATLCLFHDVSAAMGVLMVLDMTSKWTGLDAKINLGTIAAFLTIVGFSINDTIVTFDRMRENLGQAPPKDRNQYEATLERSINQTLSRTVLTSFTVFLVLVVLALAGVPSLMGFTLALLAGVVFGTFSSIAVATPILLSEPRRLATIVAAEFIVFVGLGIAGGYLRL